MDKTRLQYLLRQQHTGNSSAQEAAELQSFLEHPENQYQIEEYIQGLLEYPDKELQMNGELREETLQRILAAGKPDNAPGFKVIRATWFRYAAAILLLVIGTGAYFYYTSANQTELVQHTPAPTVIVGPGSDKAVLTLSNGQQILLASTAQETITDGAVSIKNHDGQLSYKNTEAVAINTMSTPRGGQYKLTLADGTRVWLNAASSITYPTSFTGKIREVSITGEAYLEVAKDKEKPFTVKTARDKITVLGTSFNINAYTDEPVIKTSLLEGSVKVGELLLKPGQAYKNGKVTTTDIQQDIAWKNGAFSFKNIDFESAMRQLERWYNVDIVYDNGLPKSQLNGEMDRNLTLQDALAGLDGLGARFRLEGKTVHVIAINN